MTKLLISTIAITGLLLATSAFKINPGNVADEVRGAWRLQEGSIEQVLVFQDGYFSHTIFDKSNKKFISTWGGVYKIHGKSLNLVSEFNSALKENVGSKKELPFSVNGKMLHADISGTHQHWTKIDEGNDNLAGVWRITGRMVDGKKNTMQRGDRKTLKLLSGSRFQWMAINPATKEFFGTGGGTYTFTNGKYTEQIEFFSRDSSRVGATLSFEGSVKDGEWNHSGKSSKGDPLNEVWTKESYFEGVK